jgi:hypothetical protein
MEVIHMHFNASQLRRLMKGETVQLTASQMTSKAGQVVELHMLKKHGAEMRRAIKKGKSYRFSPKKIEISGGRMVFPITRMVGGSSAVMPPVFTPTILTQLAVPAVKPKAVKKGNASKKRAKAKKPKGDAVLIEGLGKMKPVTVGVYAPMLKSALKPAPVKPAPSTNQKPPLMKGKGKVEEVRCSICDAQIKRDHGAENDTLLTKPTPRIRSKYIPL